MKKETAITLDHKQMTTERLENLKKYTCRPGNILVDIKLLFNTSSLENLREAIGGTEEEWNRLDSSCCIKIIETYDDVYLLDGGFFNEVHFNNNEQFDILKTVVSKIENFEIPTPSKYDY